MMIEGPQSRPLLRETVTIAPRLTVEFFASAKRNIVRFKTPFVQMTRSIHIEEMKSGFLRKFRSTKPLTQLYSRDSQLQLKSYGA